MSKTSFVKGAAILGIAGLLGKLIGALYRIPLTNIIGPEGMGLYQIAYPIYAFLVVISTAGLPTAISKMVSERVAWGDPIGAHRVFRMSFKILIVIGISSMFLMLAGNQILAQILGNSKSNLSIMAIAPSLFFVSILSAYRGYFQGFQMMAPTAVSQVVEQFVKLLIGLTLAIQWKMNGVEYGAAGALTGVTLGELAALVLLVGVYSRIKRMQKKQGYMKKQKATTESYKDIGLQLFRIAVPVTLGASIMPLVGFVDTILVINRLKVIGFAQSNATALFGLLTGAVNTLVNMPAVLTVALSMSLVPAIAESFARKDQKSVKKKTLIGLRLAMLIGLPSSIGLFFLAEPILRMLYTSFTNYELMVSTHLLQMMSIGIVFLFLIQTTTGILQGMGRVMIPVRNLCIGASLKVIASYLLIGMPFFNIQGATIGTVVCYSVAAVLNMISVFRVTDMRIPYKELFCKPMLSAGGMIVAIWLVRVRMIQTGQNGSLGTLLTILAGMITYGILLLITGTLKEEDMTLMPGGEKVNRMMRRTGLWKLLM